MTVPFARPAQQPFETRRGEVLRVEEMSGGVFVVAGWQETEGSGEAVFDVAFPVRFTEEPIPTFGSVLGANQAIESGNYPQITGTVKTWIEVTEADGTVYWVGASVIVVALGHEGMKAKLSFRMEAKAIQNPIRDPGSADDQL